MFSFIPVEYNTLKHNTGSDIYKTMIMQYFVGLWQVAVSPLTGESYSKTNTLLLEIVIHNCFLIKYGIYILPYLIEGISKMSSYN